MQDEDEDDPFEVEFEDWFDRYMTLFPSDLAARFEPHMEIYAFYKGIYANTMLALTPEVRKLLFSQYPEMETEARPGLVSWINRHIASTGPYFLIRLFALLYDDRQGVDFRKKYPDFDRWMKEYARPKDPLKVLKMVFEASPWLTEGQKQQMTEDTLGEVDWKELRKKEFRDMLFRVLQTHYPQVENLSADGWIVYAALTIEAYSEFRFESEAIWEFIRCGLSEEDLQLTASEIHEKIMLFYNQKYATLGEKANNDSDQV